MTCTRPERRGDDGRVVRAMPAALPRFSAIPPAGAVIGFGELIDPAYPGRLGDRRLEFQHVPYVPGPAFVVPAFVVIE